MLIWDLCLRNMVLVSSPISNSDISQTIRISCDFSPSSKTYTSCSDTIYYMKLHFIMHNYSTNLLFVHIVLYSYFAAVALRVKCFLLSVLFHLACGISYTSQGVSSCCCAHKKFSFCLLSYFIIVYWSIQLCKYFVKLHLLYHWNMTWFSIRKSQHSSSAQRIILNEALSLRAAVAFIFAIMF